MRDLVNTYLGQYQIIEIIQHGGMATVYKAFQPSLDRMVAIKVLLNNDPQFVARFKREAHAIGHLHHENILPIYDYGEQNGLLFFVMQYVESGTTLAHMLGGLVEPVRALRLTRLILNGLGYAHERGVIHRDIKPSNILMPRPDWPMLADFGIAIIADDRQKLTVPGNILGTVAYMAPEQGDGRPVDARTDLYAVGVMLYEMLTGRVPFVGASPIVVIKMHLQEPPPPPRSINPHLPEVVASALIRALEKDPDKRYQNVKEMARDIDQLIAQIDHSVTLAHLARMYQAATDAFRHGQWTIATEHLRQVIALDPDYEDSRALLEAAQEEQQRAETMAQQRIETIQQRRHTVQQQRSELSAAPTPASGAVRLPAEDDQSRGAAQPIMPVDSAKSAPGASRRLPWSWRRILLILFPALAVAVVLLIIAQPTRPFDMFFPRGNTDGAGEQTSAALPAPPGNLVYTDDFSQGVAGSGLARGVQSGAYRIDLTRPNDVRWVILPRFAYSNGSVQIDLSDGSETFDGNVAQGVLLHGRDSSHFYAVLIDPRSGRYTVRKQNGSETIELVPPTISSLIKQQAEINRLRVDALDSQFTVYLNESQLMTFRDADYAFGLVGLIVANESATAPRMQFDNISVWSADTPTLATGLPALREDSTGAMALIPGGEFSMGGNAQPDEAAHIVPIPSFYIDRTEVTNEAYAQCVKAERCTPPQSPDSQTNAGYTNDPQFAKYPVVNVTWQQARDFCNYAGKQLPTEADWEKAASWDSAGRQKLIWSWGNAFDPARLNSSEAALGDTSAVDQFPPGLYDVFGMSGNVLEWTSSAYQPYPYDPADGREDPTNAVERVLRGGAWTQNQEATRTFVRQHAAPDTARNDIGFRCVATP
jgi:formylglycine-generating enzyme required for sulfatase activity